MARTTDPAESLRVRVPASTSNLGPGFDFLGLALSLYLTVRISPKSGGERSGAETTEPRTTWSGPTASEIPEDGPDLVRLAFGRAAAELDLASAGLLSGSTEIPVGRGFGSSGAAVAAGLLLANACAATPLPLPRLLALGLELEGHPDNVTASLVGGCTLCHPRPEPGAAAPCLVPHPIHASIGFALAWPDTPLSTARARAALPQTVPFADAVENPRRLALLLEGLRTGDPVLLRLGGMERLHERHRLPLIPGASLALQRAREAGAWLATISGAGSGTVALGPIESMEDVAAAMQAGFGEADAGGSARVVHPVLGAPTIQR